MWDTLTPTPHNESGLYTCKKINLLSNSKVLLWALGWPLIFNYYTSVDQLCERDGHEKEGMSEKAKERNLIYNSI